MKLFRTSDISVIAYCREMFQFDLPSAILKKHAEKFDSALLNWHYIELLVKILCIKQISSDKQSEESVVVSPDHFSTKHKYLA